MILAILNKYASDKRTTDIWPAGTVTHACNHSHLGGSGVWDQPGQHGETTSLLKIQKLAGYDGACL